MSLRVSLCLALGVVLAPVAVDADEAGDRRPRVPGPDFSPETVAQAFRALSAAPPTPCAALPGISGHVDGSLGRALIGHAFACEDFVAGNAEAVGRRPAASFAAISGMPGAGDGAARAPFALSFQRFGLPDAISVPDVIEALAEPARVEGEASWLAAPVAPDLLAASQFQAALAVAEVAPALAPLVDGPEAPPPLAAAALAPPARAERDEASPVVETGAPVIASDPQDSDPQDSDPQDSDTQNAALAVAERRREEAESTEARQVAARRAAIARAAVQRAAIRRARQERLELEWLERRERLAEAAERRRAVRAAAAARRRAMRTVSVSRTVRDPGPRTAAAIRARRPAFRAAQRAPAAEPAAVARPQARSFSPKMSSAGPAQPAPRQ